MGKSICYNWVKADSQQVLILSKCFEIQLIYRKMLKQNGIYLDGLDAKSTDSDVHNPWWT